MNFCFILLSFMFGQGRRFRKGQLQASFRLDIMQAMPSEA